MLGNLKEFWNTCNCNPRRKNREQKKLFEEITENFPKLMTTDFTGSSTNSKLKEHEESNTKIHDSKISQSH